MKRSLKRRLYFRKLMKNPLVGIFISFSIGSFSALILFILILISNGI